jgi:hypothetical protein
MRRTCSVCSISQRGDASQRYVCMVRDAAPQIGSSTDASSRTGDRPVAARRRVSWNPSGDHLRRSEIPEMIRVRADGSSGVSVGFGYCRGESFGSPLGCARQHRGSRTVLRWTLPGQFDIWNEAHGLQFSQRHDKVDDGRCSHSSPRRARRRCRSSTARNTAPPAAWAPGSPSSRAAWSCARSNDRIAQW